jgi:superfamily II DNA or RNA helicase/diadenosine tetraphosphate (Ap4A) HIT family hydrolase
MTCPFCSVDSSRIAFANEHVIAIWDAFPVNPGHLLIISRSHAPDWVDLSAAEKAAVWSAVDEAEAVIAQRFRPEGFNLGVNQGAAAGQTVFHFHLHVIPRYTGDVLDPRGGVRHVVPARANYLAGREPLARKLVTGGEDPLLAHLRMHLDQASSCDIAVAFLLNSGASLIVEHLRDFLDRGGRARILVGDYLDVTEPVALRRLNDLTGNLELRAYEAIQRGFHPKAYIFRTESDAIAFVGSSNLSEPALTDSVEWNYKVISSHEQAGFADITRAFEDLFHAHSTVLANEAWIRRYEERRVAPDWRAAGVAEEAPAPLPIPHELQRQALEALEATRSEGFSAGLVVLATGLGKTLLAAFDSNSAEFRRILFIAHRDEILNQAIESFRRMRPDASIGRLTGSQREISAELLFASIQTLGRIEHLARLAPNAFDYIVVDEFHHAAASTYRRVIDYFEPKFLLGLTATPERMDGGDLLALCQENLVFSASIPAGVAAGLLSPFRYWGVPDEVDYSNIPWRNARFDPDELEAAIATEARAASALEQFRKYSGKRCIGFCCSRRHADFMAQFFTARGVRAVAVHSGEDSAPRARSLERLAAGELDVIFPVDIFNEGVDMPNLDMVLMLRPTESIVIWMQQFGRGLRRSFDKPFLTVVDYIGNHRAFLTKLRAIAALAGREANSDAALRQTLDDVMRQQLQLPAGCSVTYDLVSVEILQSLLRPTAGEAALEAFYDDFLDRHGVRPTAVEAYHEGFNPRGAGERSWLGFLARKNGLDPREAATYAQLRAFLESIEKTPMTRSYKAVLLLAMMAADALPGSVGIEALTEQVTKLAARFVKVREDFSVDISDTQSLGRLLIDNPIRAFAEAEGTGGVQYFRFEAEQLSTTFDANDVGALRDLLHEVLDWRLAQYLDRAEPGAARADVLCKVARATGERPILFLPKPAASLGLETGPTTVQIEGQQYEAVIAKIAINVIRKVGEETNRLPEILRGWFGEDAGLPGRGERVRLKRGDADFELEPLRVGVAKTPALWRRYAREDIASAFGHTFNPAIWNAGFVLEDPDIFLLVTLEKKGMIESHRYSDHFLSAGEFAWQTQNRTKQASKHGQLLHGHHSLGKRVHLFVRPTKKTGSSPTPFIYCGQVDFESWEGEAPITIKWRLRRHIPVNLRPTLGVSE